MCRDVQNCDCINTVFTQEPAHIFRYDYEDLRRCGMVHGVGHHKLKISNECWSFSVFPAPILFGYVLDSACLVLRGACSATKSRRGGACALYDPDVVRYRVFALCIGLKACALLIYIGAYFISKRPEYSDFDKTEGRPDEESEAVQIRRKDRQANKRLSQISVDVVDQAITSIWG